MSMDEAASAPPPAELPEIGTLTLSELFASLRAGWNDFRRAPQFGIFFSAFYVLGGIALWQFKAGALYWTLALALGFPLIAPFAAVGLYEVSRRLEAGLPLRWGEVLGVVWNERRRQLPWMGAIIIIYFLAWNFIAHLIFGLFLGASAFIDITSSLHTFTTPRGMAMLAVGTAVGAILAFILFSLTVVSLPLLLDLEVDFVTAMILSVQAVRKNLGVMLVWAAIIAGLTLLALLPMFLGLVVVMPLLGHATWHIYRRVLYTPV